MWDIAGVTRVMLLPKDPGLLDFGLGGGGQTHSHTNVVPEQSG